MTNGGPWGEERQKGRRNGVAARYQRLEGKRGEHLDLRDGRSGRSIQGEGSAADRTQVLGAKRKSKQLKRRAAQRPLWLADSPHMPFHTPSSGRDQSMAERGRSELGREQIMAEYNLERRRKWPC